MCQLHSFFKPSEETLPSTGSPPAKMSVLGLNPAAETPSRLLALPGELQDGIINHLDAPSKLALQITNRHFQSLVKISHAELLVAEKSRWAEQRSLFACMDCCRLRHSREFGDTMKKGPKARGGSLRYCIDCGLHPKPGTTRYSPGSEIKVRGVRNILCLRCRKYTGDVGCIGSRECHKCHIWTGCKCTPARRLKYSLTPNNSATARSEQAGESPCATCLRSTSL